MSDAKAACLYPNAGRAIREAKRRGFDAVVRDPLGNVAEFATGNLVMIKDGVAQTAALRQQSPSRGLSPFQIIGNLAE